MRIRVLSDLHLETPANRDWRPPAVDCDVVVLAGDVAANPIAAATWATAHFDVPVVSMPAQHCRIWAAKRETAEGRQWKLQ